MSNIKKLKEVIAENYNPQALFADGLDGAIVGVGCQWGQNYVAIYDSSKCIEILKNEYIKTTPELSDEDACIMAEEWFSYNVECAFVGPNTPIFITPVEHIVEE